MVKWFTTILLLMGCVILNAQRYRFEDPVRLPEVINSGSPELLPFVSPGGHALYFCRGLSKDNKGGKYAGHDVWVAGWGSEGWTEPSNKHFDVNTKGNDGIIGFGAAGDVIYLMRNYPNKEVKGIYFSKYFKEHWTEPELIPIEGLDTKGSMGFYMHPDGDVLLISMVGTDSEGEEDIYISLKGKDGRWSPVRNISSTVNTPGFEISPFLSADKRRLYFSSNGHEGFGDGDIFMSERLYESYEIWTMPINLGQPLNTDYFEGYFSIVDDTVGYFVSNRSSTYTDIYSVHFKIKEIDPYKSVTQLRESEVAELIGANVNRTLTFSRENTGLDATQRELIWYIANKLISKKHVRVLLVPSPNDSEQLTDERLNGVVTQLVSAGMEGSRIRRSNPITEMPPGLGEVHLVLVR